MSQQIASLWVEITADASRLVAGLKQSKSEMSKFWTKANEVTQKLTGLNVAQLSVSGAILAGANAARKAVNEYSSYAERIDKLTMSTGMSSEELSRLVQVADDFRVEMGAMEGALKMALQNGFNPTTDALADLADQYNSFNDKAEGAAFLQEKFGKSWQNIVPLLSRGGDAIREASNGIADGLIVTEQGIQANREYQKAIDDWNDAWAAASNTMAQQALPALTNILNSVNNLNVELANSPVRANGGIIMSPAEWRAETAEIDYANDFIRENMRAQQDLAPAIAVTNDEMRYFDQHLSNAAAKAQSMASASDNLAGAVANLQEAQANWKENAGGDMAQILENTWMPAGRLEEGLKAIDEVQGTSFLTAKELKDAQEKLGKEFATGKITADEFKTKLGEMNDKFMPLDESVKSSTLLMEDLLAKLREFSREWTASVRIQAGSAMATLYGGKTGPIISPTTGQVTDMITATGVGGYNGLANFVVPPGYNEKLGKPFWIQASSGETVNIERPGNTYVLNAYHTQSPQAVSNSFSIMQAMGGL